ncbi:AAA family ATPase [Umezawaea beigongshangensis]|uniref:AAA family ATPase n=1 Tax=Umezawaea beigongshangensis TaxID=2780383 RepID=UPI0018F1AD07|nr:AAA family ATPase [Umezawaea beigongshangensis]
MARSVLLIAGPPCSGKSTLAHELARPGDLVIDRDLIARQLGSSRTHMHTPYITRLAEQRTRAHLAALAADHREITAYVVRCAPRARQREALAARLGATVRLVDPGIDECQRRARAARRPPGTFQAIRQWYARAESAQDERALSVRRPCMDCGGPATSVRCGRCCERLRAGRPWRTMQARVCAEETHCWICGQWVDQDLHTGHPRSRTVDHVHALRDGGAVLDRDNVRLAHRSCNTGRSNRSRAGRAQRRTPLIVDPRTV